METNWVGLDFANAANLACQFSSLNISKAHLIMIIDTLMNTIFFKVFLFSHKHDNDSMNLEPYIYVMNGKVDLVLTCALRDW